MMLFSKLLVAHHLLSRIDRKLQQETTIIQRKYDISLDNSEYFMNQNMPVTNFSRRVAWYRS